MNPDRNSLGTIPDQERVAASLKNQFVGAAEEMTRDAAAGWTGKVLGTRVQATLILVVAAVAIGRC
jgi:hypothetical protein